MDLCLTLLWFYVTYCYYLNYVSAHKLSSHSKVIAVRVWNKKISYLVEKMNTLLLIHLKWYCNINLLLTQLKCFTILYHWLMLEYGWKFYLSSVCSWYQDFGLINFLLLIEFLNFLKDFTRHLSKSSLWVNSFNL